MGAAADEALARRLNVSVERLHALLARLDHREISLDDASRPDSVLHLTDSLAATGNPEQCYFEHRRSGVVGAAVAAALLDLDPRERFIAEQRLMASPAEALTLAEIGRRIGVSRERARQLEERAKRKLARSPAIRENSELDEWLAE